MRFTKVTSKMTSCREEEELSSRVDNTTLETSWQELRQRASNTSSIKYTREITRIISVTAVVSCTSLMVISTKALSSITISMVKAQ